MKNKVDLKIIRVHFSFKCRSKMHWLINGLTQNRIQVQKDLNNTSACTMA